MAVKGNSSSERTTRWDVLLTNLRSSLPDMPQHVVDDFKALDALLPQARALETQREDLRSQARAAKDQHKQILNQGDGLRARIGSTLKGKFGFTDATLVKYGLTPLPTAHKRKSSTTTPPPPEVQPTPVTAPKETVPAPASGAK